MAIGPKSLAREAGTAIAVLALYLLVLLTPWHQANALQADLAEVGYASAAIVDICGQPASGGEQRQTVAKCPIAGIGKFDFAGLEPQAISFSPPRIGGEFVYPDAPLAGLPGIPQFARQARAPPAIA